MGITHKMALKTYAKVKNICHITKNIDKKLANKR